MNEFIQTDDTVVQGYESLSEYDPEEMTSNEETIQIKAEASYTKLQDKDLFYGNDVVRKAAEILSVTSGELRAKETRRERPTTAQKCPRSTLNHKAAVLITHCRKGQIWDRNARDKGICLHPPRHLRCALAVKLKTKTCKRQGGK